MNVRRGLWRTWIVVTTIWIAILLLTGKYWCPLFFWRDSPQCPANSYYEQSMGLFGLPLATLIVGLIVGWIISGFRARKS